MKKRNSLIARILAALALIAVVVAVVMIVSAGLKDESSSSSKKSGANGANHPAKKEQPKKKKKATPKTYTVQSGDTLSSIAHKFGLTVAELQTLNPEVDAQILTVGEVLKLRE